MLVKYKYKISSNIYNISKVNFMAIYQKDIDAIKKHLWADEEVHVTATQRKIGPGGSLITPTTVVLTNKRILILNRATFGLRKDIEAIPYSMVASVRIENGFISSSVFLRVGGYTSQGERGFLKPGEQEGEISGLRKIDAVALSDFVERVISNEFNQQVQEQPLNNTFNQSNQNNLSNNNLNNSVDNAADTKNKKTSKKKGNKGPANYTDNSNYIFCSECGTKNDTNANFCSKCGAKLK